MPPNKALQPTALPPLRYDRSAAELVRSAAKSKDVGTGGLMRPLLILACAILASLGPLAAVTTAAGDAVVRKAFIMTEAEDGKLFSDSFEVWDTFCALRPSPTVGVARCSITAVSLAESGGRTHVFTWRHDSQSIREVQPGVFRIEMNGRLSDCSGLQVIMRLDKDLATVESIEGDMRAGTRCQSRRTFSLDRTRPTRAIPPLWNPAYRLP